MLNKRHRTSRRGKLKHVGPAADHDDRGWSREIGGHGEDMTKHILGEARPCRGLDRFRKPLFGFAKRLDWKYDPQVHACQRKKSSAFGRNNSPALPSRGS